MADDKQQSQGTGAADTKTPVQPATKQHYRFQTVSEMFFALLMHRVKQGNADTDLVEKAKEMLPLLKPPSNTSDAEGQMVELNRAVGMTVQVASRVHTAIKSVVVV